jgi:hypothetical protein
MHIFKIFSNYVYAVLHQFIDQLLFNMVTTQTLKESNKSTNEKWKAKI